MSTLSSVNVTDVNLVLKERTHMRLCLNMLIFTHNLGNWLMVCADVTRQSSRARVAGSMGGDVPEKYYVVQNNEMVRVKYVLVYTSRDSPRRLPLILSLMCPLGSVVNKTAF